MSEQRFHVRTDIQGKQQDSEGHLTAAEVEDLLREQIRAWLAEPTLLLQLTCGDTRFAVTAAGTKEANEILPGQHQPPSADVESEAHEDDAVTVASMESFPASDAPATTRTDISPS